MYTNLGRWTVVEIDRIIHEASTISDTGERISFLSDMFLGLSYREATLHGNSETEEVLTVDFSGVDCFTFIDYVEAMRRSDSFNGFLANLRTVRYRNGTVVHEKRNHFFTDWAENGLPYVTDVTEEIGGGKARSIVKTLNLRDNGTPILPGIKTLRRIINFIPAETVDSTVLAKLRSGDYAGIYSPLQGLDVSHVGIIRKVEKTIILTHASSDSRHRKVIDQDLREYISGKPGLLVLRARDLGT